MSKLEEMAKKVQELKEKKEKFLQSLEPKRLKSSFVTCPGCKSLIRKDLWKGIRCPACGEVRISETAKKGWIQWTKESKSCNSKKCSLKQK